MGNCPVRQGAISLAAKGGSRCHTGQMAPQAKDMLDAFRDNLADELKAKNLDMQTASTEAKLGKTFARDVIKRGRDPQLSFIAKLARAHGLSMDRLLELPRTAISDLAQKKPILVRGEVGAGLWHEQEANDFEAEPSPFPPDPLYPAESQYDLIVRGNSINRFARDGERLRVVDLARANIDYSNDDLVVVQKKRDGGHLIETTAKRIRIRGPIIELWPDSDDPRWQQPERIDTRQQKDGEGAIIALVLYSYNPARRGRR